MKYLKARNWEKFQHFKDRRPPWIKLYRDILDDYNYHQLPVESKAIAPLLWLMASEAENSGMIEGDIKVISFRLRMSESDLIKAIKPLVEYGFFESDIEMISSGYRGDLPEERREREEREKRRECFEIFWDVYGYKKGKQDAEKIYLKLLIKGILPETILTGAKRYKQDCDKKNIELKFRKHPTTWLNGAHWNDEYPEEKNRNIGIC